MFPKSLGRQIPSLPANRVHIDAPSQDRRHWQARLIAGCDAIAPSLQPTPAYTFQERITALNPSLQSLLEKEELLLLLEEIAALLAVARILTLSAMVAPKPTEAVMVRSQNPVQTRPGQRPRPTLISSKSLCHDGLGPSGSHSAGLFLFASTVQIHDSYFQRKSLLVKRITKMQNWKKLYPSTALLPEWDLLSAILC
jgi:hypothetical protein